MLEGLQVHLERIVELGNRAGEDDGPARRVFLDDRKAVGVGELPDKGDIGRVGAVLPSELLAAQMAIRALAPGQLRHSVLQRVAPANPQQHADFQPLRGIGLPDGARSPHWLSLATGERMSWHG